MAPSRAVKDREMTHTHTKATFRQGWEGPGNGQQGQLSGRAGPSGVGGNSAIHIPQMTRRGAVGVENPSWRVPYRKFKRGQRSCRPVGLGPGVRLFKGPELALPAPVRVTEQCPGSGNFSYSGCGVWFLLLFFLHSLLSPSSSSPSSFFSSSSLLSFFYCNVCR